MASNLPKDRAKIKDVAEWEKARKITPDMVETAKIILREIQAGEDTFKTIRRYPVAKRGNISKHVLVTVYRAMVESGEIEEDEALLAKIRMKPMRTLSGVTTVTVLTRPYPCPGKCIFCPSDARMPKSYLPDEPGAARAYQNDFDPYLQVQSRINTYQAVGHPTNKIELLILGGSWTYYPEAYQKEFVQRCLDAMNGLDSSSLEEAQRINETSECRNVGLVVETRPDEINAERLLFLRKLGVTKIQLGIQSLNDEILAVNRRGHTVKQALEATALCREAGFKLVMHWMPNLLGTTAEMDKEDFARLWLESDSGLGFCPDELKIYPTQLLENSDLYQQWKNGLYHPYDTDTLISLIAGLKMTVPRYCRINRIIRDIPSHHIVAGSTRSSLRMDVQKLVKRSGGSCKCIRCREIRGQAVDQEDLTIQDTVYYPAHAKEHFLEIVTSKDKLIGYLRLSIPLQTDPGLDIDDLRDAAIIREIHIYGQSVDVGSNVEGAAQHSGFGKTLIEKAKEIAILEGKKRLSVIAAIGTRNYYLARGFSDGTYYMTLDLESDAAAETDIPC
ncbi:MAG: tRNA uridine(34) 5-carboxymethylaminomethyl modification radical SAM/GNAT enzyme Elp3 [Chloroflexi bacterium]|nr:tRNA uridine(34) 5-carboxymethylaminomethyl modification radical SAM/GNAT enzyme Elp3 [Chloroflexota bacterium]